MAAVQYFTRNTQPKTCVRDRGGWHRPHDRARMYGERNGNDEGDKDDDDEYGKDGNIPDEPFDFFHATTNQKYAGVMEGGWDRPHDHARMFEERDGNDEGNEDDNEEYGKDGNIPNKPFDFFHATTNQKHTGVTEGEWYRPHNRART